MTIKVGDKVPSAKFQVVNEGGGGESVAADAFCAGKKVVLFALPGAYTPTCSKQHLPGFVARAAELAGKGVDVVACLSVNDSFVMAAWGADQGAFGKVAMIADGNGEFTKAVGLEVDLTAFGLGVRSQRYAMIVEDGVLKALDVDAGGKFEVSSCEAVLKKL
ncbi:MAG: peroxiredoxin [Deltaproteobacteria bacterium]|nr:peroxiredoxin [Deltaproteobacteria bacterium]